MQTASGRAGPKHPRNALVPSALQSPQCAASFFLLTACLPLSTSSYVQFHPLGRHAFFLISSLRIPEKEGDYLTWVETPPLDHPALSWGWD